MMTQFQIESSSTLKLEFFMFEQFFADLLRDLDWASIQEIFQDFDPIELAAYASIAIASLGASLQSGALMFWRKVDKPVGFCLNTFLLMTLWITVIRLHASMSFNLDREFFDDWLMLSALLFTPYYFLHYELVGQLFSFISCCFEFIGDVGSSFVNPEKAQSNKDKWGDRLKAAVSVSAFLDKFRSQ